MELMDRYCHYLEAALKEAKANGDLPGGDFQFQARELYAFLAGGLV